MEDKNLLTFEFVKDSTIVLAYCDNGSIVGQYMFMSNTDEFGYKFMFNFFPANLMGFSNDAYEVEDYLQYNWQLFNISKKI